jgi:hypothetical protein
MRDTALRDTAERCHEAGREANRLRVTRLRQGLHAAPAPTPEYVAKPRTLLANAQPKPTPAAAPRTPRHRRCSLSAKQLNPAEQQP